VEYEITWGGDPEDVTVTAWGTATVEGLDAWLRKELKDPRFRPRMRVLIDYRQLDWSGLSPEDLHKRVEVFARAGGRVNRARSAVVMRSPVDFGIARMEQAYFELHLEPEVEMGVFLSIEDARRWLSEVPAPDSDSASA
jgi:hypothetical protein